VRSPPRRCSTPGSLLLGVGVVALVALAGGAARDAVPRRRLRHRGGVVDPDLGVDVWLGVAATISSPIGLTYVARHENRTSFDGVWLLVYLAVPSGTALPHSASRSRSTCGCSRGSFARSASSRTARSARRSCR
jgi:hypothetical protein